VNATYQVARDAGEGLGRRLEGLGLHLDDVADVAIDLRRRLELRERRARFSSWFSRSLMEVAKGRSSPP
jgi:hypothetical protein